MKNLTGLFAVVLAVLALAGCSEKDLRQAYDIITGSTQGVPLAQAEVVAAVKDSLLQGISKGALIASARGGYFGNPRV